MIRSRKRVKELGEVFTPEYIVEKMLDLFPEEVWYDSKFNFLEPSAGTGVFIKSILKRRMKFLSEEICRKTIYAVEIDEINCEELKQFEINLTKGNFLEEYHKFKNISNLIVVGNPPYQMQTEAQKNRSSENAQSKPLYHLFVEAIIDGINPNYFSMIIPSRWMVGGMGLNNHRDRMMNDTRMKKIVHFPGDKEIFDSVSITGGVNYFLWQNNYNGDCEFIVGDTKTNRLLNEYDIILQDNKARTILEKVRQKTNVWMNKSWSGQTPFGIITSFKKWKESGVPCVAANKQRHFVDSADFSDKHCILNKWKVCTSSANGAAQIDNGAGKRVISETFILEPDSVCTQTYIVMNVFDNKIEADSFSFYVKSKLFRFMLGLRVGGDKHINKEKFSWVPDMEDYTKEYTDEYLYKKFGLNEEEIAYIESKIKTLEPKKS